MVSFMHDCRSPFKLMSRLALDHVAHCMCVSGTLADEAGTECALLIVHNRVMMVR